MKTDETNLPRDPAKVTPKRLIDPVVRTTPVRGKAQSEREEDALDAWRDRKKGDGAPDPIQVHGFDMDEVSPRTRAVIEAFSADLAHLHEALEAAERRLTYTEDARRHDPETGLLRRDALFTETRHLEALDQQEGLHSGLALLIVVGMDRLRQEQGRAAADHANAALGQALAAVIDPGEPAGRVGEGEFAVLLTGLSGKAAKRRADEMAENLTAAVDSTPELRALRPGSVVVGVTELDPREDPQEALDRADQAARAGQS